MWSGKVEAVQNGATDLELVLSGLSLRCWVEKINRENLFGWNHIVSASILDTYLRQFH